MSQPELHPRVVQYYKWLNAGEGFFRTPDDPCDYPLEDYEYVWYEHGSGLWYPAQVMTQVMPNKKPQQNQMFKDKNVWYGLTIGPDLSKPKEKMHVYLCPQWGNAKPDSRYTRNVLKRYKKLPEDDARIEQIMKTFKNAIVALPSNSRMVETIKLEDET